MPKHPSDGKMPATIVRFPVDPASAPEVTHIPVQVALYERPVRLGSVNPYGEISYEGYQRVQTTAVDGRTPKVTFPAVGVALRSVLVTHVVVMLLDGTVVACVPVRPLYIAETDVVHTDVDEALSGAWLSKE